MSLDELGRIDMGRISELVKTTPDLAATELLAAKLIYRVPRTKADPSAIRYETADQYLSGDVRRKLAQAEAAARKYPERWQDNVDALKAVQPPDIPPSSIDVALGASWIPPTDVRDFCRDILDLHDVEVGYNAADGSWSVTGGRFGRGSVKSTVEWGTKRMDALSLIGAGLNQRVPEVFDTDENDRRIKNLTETLSAQEKMQKLNDRFSKWVFEDDDRALRLAKKYNVLFNGVRLRVYDGSHLTLQGSSSAIKLNRHQLDAVWRGMQSNTLLAHAVGSGKTFVGIAIAMESRRVGLCNLPVLAVPNHMLEQASREWQQLYPNANILAATAEDLAETGRLRLQAKIACGNYDGVVMTHNGLGHIAVSPETERKFISEECDELRKSLDEAKRERDSSLTIKSIEKSIRRLEEKLEEKLNTASKDKMVWFEELGIDKLIVDESHLFKNLSFATRQQGVNATGSQRAMDLFMKIRYLESVHPGNCVTFMSATPIANSIAETFTNQRYLQLASLKAKGIAHYDSWSANYARPVTSLELDTTGGFRVKTRIAKFANVPELTTMFREFADVITKDMLNLPVPAIKGGKPRVVTVTPSSELTDYISTLAERAEAIRCRSVTADQDNMLQVCTDGRRASLDLRLLGIKSDGTTKIDAASREIMRIYESSKNNEYRNKDGSVSSVRGACQIVFCDTSTPAKNDGSWNAYDALKSSLIAAGMPANKIRFIHEADGSDEKKARLFRDCREGRVSVIVGSTEKLGCGTNIQDRLIAEIALDAPYRPDQVEQRSGRSIRQFNQNSEVEIIRIVTEQSFDSYMWQMLERKQGFISQVMKGTLQSRIVEDVDMAMSFAEVKALATGNPMLMEKAGVDAEVGKLLRLRQSHDEQQWRLRGIRLSSAKEIERLTDDGANLDRSIRQRRETAGDTFAARIGSAVYSERKAAGLALITAARAEATKSLSLDARGANSAVLGFMGGFPIRCAVGGRVPQAAAELILAAPFALSVGMVTLADEPDPLGIVRSLEHKLRSFDAIKAQVADRIIYLSAEVEKAEQQIGAEWEGQPKLDAALKRQGEIEALLRSPSPEREIGPILEEVSEVDTASASVARNDVATTDMGAVTARSPGLRAKRAAGMAL